MEIDVDVRSIVRMGHTYQAAAPIVADEATKSMYRAVIPIEREAKHLVPTDTHDLQRSLTHEVKATSGMVVGKVGTNKSYGKIVEEGRTPGLMPPEGKLLGWMGRHGIAPELEFVIRRAINRAKKPRPYLKPALEKNLAAISREFGQIPARVMKRLAAKS